MQRHTFRRPTSGRISTVALTGALALAVMAGPGIALAQDASPPAAEPGVVVPAEAQAAIDELRGKLAGQSLVMGSSAFPNASITGQFKTAEILRDVFGLQVDFRLLDSDPLIAAQLSGQVAVGGLSLAGMAAVNEGGAGFVGIAGDDQKNTFVVASKDPIESMEQLAGQPFGATQNLQQITGQTARKCLDTVGLDIENDVQLIRLSNTGETTQAIRSGQIAGGISATFRLTQLTLDDGDIYNILCRGWETNPQLSTVWMVTRDWLAQNPDLALALNIASLLSARWAANNPGEWVALATSEVEGLSPEAAAIDYQTLVVELDDWPQNGTLDRELCQQTLDTSLEFEVISQPIACEEALTFDYQDQALQILGAIDY